MRANEIAARLAGRADEFARWIYPQGTKLGRDWCVGSLAGEAGKSLKICIEGSRAGRWADFGGGQEDRGDLIGLLRQARSLSLREACDQALDWLGIPEADRATGADRAKPATPIPPKPIETRAPSESWLRLQARMTRGSPEQIITLAETRRLPATAGIELAAAAGQLWFADLRDHGFDCPAWILTDGTRRNAQARRLDGKPWESIGGKKAKTIPGCEASWPVGIAEALTKPEIALVEGGPDFLAAWHFIWLTGRTADISPVAMFGVSHRIHMEALPLFKHKRVWIFAHDDDNHAGLLGGMQWRTQLRKAGATSVEFFDFTPNRVKDLNELATQHAQFEEAV